MPLPADVFLTINQLNVFFQSLTLSMLGLAADAYSSVRVGWPTDGAPAWKIDEDIVFLKVLESDSDYNRQRDVLQLDLDEDNCNLQTSYTRVLGITWVFYGPSSYDRAQSVRDQLFYPNTHAALAAQHIYLIPDVKAPTRLPELYQGRWWERTDLQADFNEKTVRNLAVPYLKSADITVLGDEPPGSLEADVTPITIVRS